MVRFKVLIAMKIQVEVFWVVMPCNVMVGYQCFCASIFAHKSDYTKFWNKIINQIETIEISFQ
jgi:hypothetical protein